MHPEWLRSDLDVGGEAYKPVGPDQSMRVSSGIPVGHETLVAELEMKKQERARVGVKNRSATESW